MTQIDYFTATAPDVVVYVDSNGNPLYTSTVGDTPATAAPVSAASVNVDYVAPAAAADSTPVAAPAPVATSTADQYIAPAPSASSSSSSGSNSGLSGITYSPYGGSYAANNVGCKTQDQVNADFALIDSSKYNLVRIYGTDCNQVSNVLAAASAKKMKVMAGVFDINNLANELNIIIEAGKGQWDNIHTISIGNELVNAGKHSASEVVNAVNSARSTLTAAGFTGKVVTVDTFIAVLNNPSLCEASDYAAVNAHPFFDGSIPACESGTWLFKTMQAVSSACGGKDTVVTETGWPTAGQTYGSAIPSVPDQLVALETMAGNVTSNVIVLTAFNDMWKNPGYLAVEQSWGIYGNSAAS